MINVFIERVTENNENVVTEFLCSMMKHKYLRDAILRSLTSSLNDSVSPNDLDSILFENISTQSQVNGGGNADISIKSNTCFFLIENKINPGTPLQSYQTSTYPKMVYDSTRKTKCLIFILPSNYHIHDHVIWERCRNYCKQNDIKKIVLIKKWSDFINDMEILEVINDNPLVGEFIGYIKNRLNLNNKTSFSRKDILMMQSPQILQDATIFYSKFWSFVKDVDINLRNIDKRLLPCDWTDMNNQDTTQIGKYLKTQQKDYAFWFGYQFTVSYNGTNMFFCIASDYLKALITTSDDSNNSYQLGNTEDVSFILKNDLEYVYFPISPLFLASENWNDNIAVFSEKIIHFINNYSKLGTKNVNL
jgi:hypothetical protein